jgi:23S rRNA pseudouridine1911/1915/1917 synthase
MQAASDPEYAAEHGARAAVTRFLPIERKAGFTLLEVEIPTGVMHQIRAHLAFIGHPLAGDALYGGPEVAGLSRHFLHAARLAFAHPDGSRARFQSALPPDLASVLQSLE